MQSIEKSVVTTNENFDKDEFKNQTFLRYL